MKRPFLSGHCNPSNPDNIHDQCRGVYEGLTCSCAHHIVNLEDVIEPAPKPTIITEPGLVYGMSDQEYHADPVAGGSLSSTFARLLTKHVPAKAEARRRNRKPTKAMNLGKAVHSHALGAGPELIVWQHDGRTKAGKEERAEWADRIDAEVVVAVTEAERDQMYGMVEALRAHPEVAAVLDSAKSEVSAFAQIGGAWVRARIDILCDDAAWDYKTAQDVTGRGFAKSMADYGYHQQEDLYRRVLRALGHPAGNVPMRFICQEVEPPYLVQIHVPDEEARALAERLNDQAIATYAECKRTGVWPGFPSLYADPTPLPTYYLFEHDDLLDLNEPELTL